MERLPSVDVNQRQEADIAGSKEASSGDTSSFGQVTEQRSTIATSSTLVQPSTQPQLFFENCTAGEAPAVVTQPQLYGPTSQSAAQPYQPSGVHTCSVSTGLDSHGALNSQIQSANQRTPSSMVEHTPESGLQSDPVTDEFTQLLMSISNHTSSYTQVTEQQIASNSFLRQQFGVQTCQTSTHQHRASNVQRQSNNQITGSTSGLPESRLQSDPLKIEMSQLLMLHDIMTKRHLCKVSFSNSSINFLYILCS